MFQQRLGGALSVCLMLLMAACGPGVGGTGTGSPVTGGAGLDLFAATPQNPCSAPFAELLACQPTAGGGDPVLASQRIFTSDCAVATFEGDAVDFDSLCTVWVFSGRWGVDGSGLARYYGLAGADPAQPPTLPATLEVRLQDGRLTVQLRAFDGESLAGPFSLQPAGPGP